MTAASVPGTWDVTFLATLIAVLFAALACERHAARLAPPQRPNDIEPFPPGDGREPMRWAARGTQAALLAGALATPSPIAAYAALLGVVGCGAAQVTLLRPFVR